MTDADQISAFLVAGLRQDIIDRRIQQGLRRVQEHAEFLGTLRPEWDHSAQLVWRLAQWVDIGYRDASLLQTLLRRFTPEQRGNLPLRDYVAIRVAEGLSAMTAEDPDEAIEHFRAVLTFAHDVADRELFSIAHFWKARCQRKKGEYDAALTHAVAARDLALECRFERMAAVMRVLESWLCFQKGKHKEALKILAEAEVLLRDTDDAVVLGNIQSTYGRIYRQEGRYDRAIDHFTRSINEYRRMKDRHPHLARALANMAYVKRLVALDLRRKIDAELAHRRQSGTQAATVELQLQHREHLAQLCEEAFAHLEEAAEVYQAHPNRHGGGTVHLNRGLLHLDNGALDLAEEEAGLAFSLGEEKDDAILMARARLLQCMVENCKLEEGIDDDPRRHAQSALDYIRDAMEFARNTQNRRLLARVHTWHGLTLSNEFYADHEGAREAMNAANAYVDHGFHGTVWEDLRVLKARVAGSNGIDATLLAWSQGEVGDRTFRQISDQFAEIVIPKVWEAEGRKIARVAAKLSISPKKVRRALARAGMLRAEAKKVDAASSAE